MRCLGFKFPSGLYRRSAVAIFFALAGTASLSAQSAFTWKYESRSLGAADRYGYAYWHVPLASLSLNGTSIPIRAEFTTDPRPDPSPSPLGKGWSVNLFGSALVEVDQNSMRWHRPDGRTYHFNLERGNASAKKPNPDAPIVYKSIDNIWIAFKTPQKRIITLRHQESSAELIYEDGLLTRFTFAKTAADTEQYVISYNRFRLPTRLALRGTGKVIAEFVYDDANRAKEFRLGHTGDPLSKLISFEYTEAALNKFSTGPYLSKLGDVTLAPLAISYVVQGTDANRIQFERLNSTSISYLTWDALSGFIQDDSSSTYKIENPSLANAGRPVPEPKAKSAEQPDQQKNQPMFASYNWRPEEAKVTRIDKEGNSEFRFYDREKGLLINKAKDGVTTKIYYLLTPGVMYGKTRKLEKLKNNQIFEQNRMAYDENGKLIRKILHNGDLIFFDRSKKNGSFTKLINGKIVETLEYSENGLVEKTHYTDQGLKNWKTFMSNGNMMVTYAENGVPKWTTEADFFVNKLDNNE